MKVEKEGKVGAYDWFNGKRKIERKQGQMTSLHVLLRHAWITPDISVKKTKQKEKRGGVAKFKKKKKRLKKKTKKKKKSKRDFHLKAHKDKKKKKVGTRNET